MTWAIGKVLISAVVISFASWLASKKPALAGFVLALPIATLLSLAFNQAQFQDTENSVRFARSVFLSIPLSLTFFVPFLLADRFKMGFWTMFLSGLVLLALSYFLHQHLFQKWFA